MRVDESRVMAVGMEKKWLQKKCSGGAINKTW